MHPPTEGASADTCPPRDRLELLSCGRLGGADRAAVDRHLAACPACRHALAQLTPYRPTETWQHPDPDATRDLRAGDTPPPEPPPEALRQHPRYRLLGILGRGGMGTVYKAEHRLLDRPVVLKVIRPELLTSTRVVERFRTEARLAARLAHPNVVAVYEAEEFGPSQMLVMEFVDGVNLGELLDERGLLPVAEACELVRQAAVGLQYVHEQGLVHRDVKPQNLLVSRAGQVKVLDLGMATIKGDQAVPVAEMTDDRQFVGTVDYASPEQWESSKDVDIRADIYSLGCTFYFLLAGEAPFPHKRYSTLMQQMWAHSQAPLPPIRDVRPDVPPELAAVLARMLAKNRDERFARPGEVAAALEPYARHCDLPEYVRTARRTSTSTADLSRVSSVADTVAAAPPAARSRTRRAVVWGVALLAAALAGGAAVALLGPKDRPTPTDAGAANDPPGAPAGPAAPTGPPIKVGVLHSRTGTMAISERGVIDATLLAVDELNEGGGVLGRPVAAVIEDGASDGKVFAAKADKLLATDKVSAVFGCWTSESRKNVLPVFERHDHLLFYPVQYEGLEQSPYVVYTGAAPNQQIIPAVKWCVGSLGKKRLFLVGSDYVFPRTAHEIIRGQAAALKAEVVGEAYLLLGSSDVAAVVKQIVAARPDAILNTVNGDSNVALFRALRAAGVTPDRVPTVSFSVSEEELSSLSAADAAGDYAAWNYFQTVDRPQNRAFVRRFHAKYGPQRVISDPMEAAYFGVHIWAQAVRAAGTEDVRKVRAAVGGQWFDAPGGRVTIDPDTRHTSKTFRVGQITDASRFEVVYSSSGPIAPSPYPGTKTRGEWDAFLFDLNLKWNGWSNPAKP